MSIRSFTQLQVWQEAHVLVLMIYKETRTFPKEELYSLIDQMRRCVVSISSNIAEGFTRHGSREKIQFYFIAKGSLTELQNQLLIARDVGYLDPEVFKRVAAQTVTVHKLLNGLLRSIK